MIGFAGLSHLGLVSSVAAASKGFDVVGYDPDASVISNLARGSVGIVEPGLPDLLVSAGSRIRFTSDPAALAACDVIYVAADVPTDQASQSDLTPIRALVSRALETAAPGTSVVVLSQVNPGFTRSLAGAVKSSNASHLFYQVETLIFGRAIARALSPERFMVGCANPAEPLPPSYARFLEAFGCPILRMRYESAELCKISINMFLVASVATTNMLAEVCEAIGADWAEIAPALRLDQRIGEHAYLTPGLGVGGGNLTRDLATIKALALEQGTDAGMIDAWNHNTRRRRDWALMMLHRYGLGRPGAAVAVWGLAYIPNTASTRNSPALALIESLQPYRVRAYDPVARLEPGLYPHASLCSSAIEACEGAEALAIMTAWPEFATIDPDRIEMAMRGRVIIDPWRTLDGTSIDQRGFSRARLGVSPGAAVPTC